MIRRFVLLVLSAVLLSLPGQQAADAASPHLSIPKLGVDARIVKVAVKDGRLMIGHDPTGVVYTPASGDPPCDSTGSTLYAGHAWRAGHGVADEWGKLKKGDVIRVAGCKFRVTKSEVWSDNHPIGSLSRGDGPPQVVLYGCEAGDYDYARVVTARLIKPEGRNRSTSYVGGGIPPI